MISPRFGRLLLLASITAIGPINLNVYLPGLPLVQSDLGASLAQVQTTVSFSMLAYGLGLLIFGPLSDHFGRRPVLLAGLVAFICGGFAGLFAPDLTTLTLARTVQSVGAAMTFVVARTVIADLAPRDALQRSVAQVTMTTLVAQMLAPMLGGFLMAAAGWRAIFAALVVAGVVLFPVAWRWLPETRGMHAPSVAADAARGAFRPMSSLFARRSFRLHLAQLGILYSCYPVFIALAPHLMIEAFDRPATEYGMYYALLPVGYFLGNGFVLRFGRSYTQTQLVRTGSLIALLGAGLSILLLAAGAWHPLALFVPAGLLANFGLGLSLPTISARAIEESRPSTGSGWSLLGFSQQLIAAGCVQLVGSLGNDGPFTLLACLAIFAGAAALAEMRRSGPMVRHESP